MNTFYFINVFENNKYIGYLSPSKDSIVFDKYSPKSNLFVKNFLICYFEEVRQNLKDKNYKYELVEVIVMNKEDNIHLMKSIFKDKHKDYVVSNITKL